MMAERKRNVEIDLLRGIAAICVVLGHSVISYPVDITKIGWCANLKQVINFFHMELFFLLAGMVYRCGDYGKFIKKKAVRLLIPYAVFGVANIVLHMFGGDVVNSSKGTNLADGLLKLATRGGEYWFLYTLFLIFAVYPFIDRILKNSRKRLIFASVVILLDCFIDYPSILTLDSLMYYLPYFVFGQVLMETFIGSRIEKKLKDGLTFKIIVIVASIAIYLLSNFLVGNLGIFGNIFKYARAFALILIAYVLISGIRVPAITSFLSRCSEYSLQIYLFNGYIMSVLRIIICRLLHIDSPLLIVLGIAIPDLLLSLIACWIVKKIPIIRDICGIAK